MQTRKADGAAKRAQHAALPSSPTDAVTSAVGHAAEEAQCIEMWRQSCSCPLPQVSPPLLITAFVSVCACACIIMHIVHQVWEHATPFMMHLDNICPTPFPRRNLAMPLSPVT